MKKRLFLITACAFVVMCLMSAGAFADLSKTNASTDGNTPAVEAQTVSQSEGDQQTNGGQATENTPAETQPVASQSVENQTTESEPVANLTTASQPVNGTATVVAKIGDTEYTDLATALTAAKATDTVTLQTDITLTGDWTPVSGFKGTLDGQNHTIYGLNITSAGNGGTGLFATLESSQNKSDSGSSTAKSIVVKNLAIDGAVIDLGSTSTQNVGVLAGSSSGSTIANVNIKNATVKTVGQYVGGLCGIFSEMGGVGGSMTSCTVSDSKITGKDQVGGLVGYLWSGETKSCSLTNNVITATEERAGGIFGKLAVTGRDSSNTRVVSNCTVSGGSATAPDYAGGITAQFMGDSNYYSITGNTVTNFGLDAGKKISAFATIRDGQMPAFLEALPTNVTGNTFSVSLDESWQKETNNYGFDVYTRTVAKIGKTYYATLEDALKSATNGATITLLKDVTLSSNFVLSNGNKVTLNLNNKTINTSGSAYFLITHGELDVTGTGTISNTGSLYAFKLVGSKTSTDANYSVLLLDRNVTLNSDAYGVMVSPYVTSTDGISAYGTAITIKGKINANYCLYLNGKINVTEGAVSTWNITDTAEITGKGDGSGIYAAGYAKWNIAGTITAPSAIMAKSGEFNITGGKYHSTGEFKDPADANGNGSEDTGAAVSVTSNDGYARKIVVNISGGEFISDNGYALYEGIAVVKNEQGQVTGKAATASYATLGVSGGTFTGNAEKGAVNISTASNKKVITGGTFSSDPTAYLADGYEAKQADGKYTVELKNADEVVSSVNSKLETETQQGEVAVEVGKGVAVEDKETAKAVASSVKADLTETKATKEITVSNDDKKTAVQKLVAAGQVKIDSEGKIAAADGGDVTITIIEEPYLEVEVTEISEDKDTGKKELKLDVTPMYNLLATTATGTDISDADKVTVSTGNALNVEEKTDVKLQLPEGFAEAGDKLLVTHTKHDGSVEYLTGKVTKEGGVLYVSFTTTGFSPIVVSDNYAATNGEQVYPTLQAAVDAAKDGDVIKLMKDGETAVVKRTVSFKVDPSYEKDGNKGNYTYTITLGDGTTRNKTDNENEWSTVYTAPAGETEKADTAKAGTAKTAKAPATGDNSELGLFAVAGLISAVGVALLLRRKQSM